MCVNPCPGKWEHSNGKGFLNQDTLAYLTPFYWQAKAPFHLRGTARNQTSLNSPDGALILASHAGDFRGARFSSLLVGRDEKRAPLKTPAWEATFPQTESLFKGYSPHKPAIIFYVNHPKSPCYLVQTSRHDTLNQYNPPGCPLTGAALACEADRNFVPR